MLIGDAGLVALPAEDWGKPVPALRRDLSMRILRTPHNVVPEHQPEYVSDWGKYRVSPNATLFAGAGDTLDALDRAGPRGAAALGAGAGLLFSQNRLMGAFAGGLLGYFGGSYLTNLLRKAISAQAPVAPAQAAAK
jgi:hypothetical protein